jgi:hypothetical protein
MIKAKDLIPEIYSNSFDMSIFTGLIDLIYGAREMRVETLKNLHSTRACAEGTVRDLARLLNLRTSNRDLIANYRYLIHNKGKEETIKNLALLCGAIPLEDNNWVDKEQDNYLIKLYVDTKNMDIAIFYELLNNIAPVGTVVELSPTTT